ncbi:hypothetical protein N7468_001631 [Penicillium chermesinum]|uniref:Uncharacterized protein n=1 Tax=Penicillium chermesinum TaxID=63820 RepID=A0A9W9PGY8_9EURO|nr:uncharacterized protein N7468_001631 [Penicillium chermesinum]KAJ5246648.1 hypothetical protein N7468_001631 [Penicillium chermesinum]
MTRRSGPLRVFFEGSHKGRVKINAFAGENADGNILLEFEECQGSKRVDSRSAVTLERFKIPHQRNIRVSCLSQTGRILDEWCWISDERASHRMHQAPLLKGPESSVRPVRSRSHQDEGFPFLCRSNFVDRRPR